MSELIPVHSEEENAGGRMTALTEAEVAAIDAEIAHVPYPSAVAIDALKIVQAHRGWVSDASLRAIAGHLQMSAEELEGVATFYNLIFRRPVGEKVILLCNSISCWIRGCDSVKAGISRRLGIGLGETTGDNRYTLLPVTCLGACDKAPVMMVGEELHEAVDETMLVSLFGAEGGANESR